MPELPEVETIVKGLRQGGSNFPSIINLKVLSAELLWERTLAYPSPGEFHTRILGQTILDIRRRGKFILLSLSKDMLLFHLRMSGGLRVEHKSAPLHAHSRLIIHLEGELHLVFNDSRKFGRAWLVKNPDEILGILGPEPLDPSFTAAELFHRLQAHRRQIKPLLLDQRFLAGLGNIYTDEALHLAQIHPLILSNCLEKQQAERLWQSIRSVLLKGVKENGASIDWVYRGGRFQNFFRVYGRAGKPCPECKTPIQRIVIGQRGSYYCPTCQSRHQQPTTQRFCKP